MRKWLVRFGYATGLLAWIGLSYGVTNLVFHKTRYRIERLFGEEVKLEDDVRIGERFRKISQEVTEERDSLQDQCKNLVGQFPNTPEIDGLQKQVGLLADQRGVDTFTMALGKQIKTDEPPFLWGQVLTVEVEGRIEPVYAMVEAIAQSPSILIVEDFAIALEGSLLKMEANLIALYYQEPDEAQLKALIEKMKRERGQGKKRGRRR